VEILRFSGIINFLFKQFCVTFYAIYMFYTIYSLHSIVFILYSKEFIDIIFYQGLQYLEGIILIGKQDLDRTHGSFVFECS